MFFSDIAPRYAVLVTRDLIDAGVSLGDKGEPERRVA